MVTVLTSQIWLIKMNTSRRDMVSQRRWKMFTHDSYQKACKDAKVNKGIFYTYDAGNSKIGGVYFCKQRDRLIKQWSNDGKVWY